MPLLNRQPFVREAPPSDLRPDEEVFVCQATKEVFRDYERFFTRHFLCNSLVWTCELSGATSLTYKQALDSERDARKVLDSLAPCYQQAALTLVHHARRTNVRTLADEICAFYRERFIVGEEVNFARKTTSGAKLICSTRVVNVILPTPKVKSPSPVKVPVISLSPLKALPPLSPPQAAVSDVKPTQESVSFQSPTPNGLPPGDCPQEATPKTRSPRTPKTPLPPLSAESTLNPVDYLYVVELIDSPEVKLQVPAKQLSRTKGTLTPRKLKLFLRNALIRPSEKHPLLVKEEYVEKFNLGPCTAELLLSPSTSARKRSLSQSNLESFFTPGSQSKRPRPTSLDALKKRKERKKVAKTPKGGKSKGRKSSASKTPKSVTRLPGTPRSPGKTPKSPRNKMEALKALNKAKKFKQMDLKKAVGKNVCLTEAEIAEMKRRTEEEREKRAAAREAEKQRRKEERQRKLQENWERKRRERMRQVEWLKPREDTLCEDSKPLPDPVPVSTQLPSDLFGEAVVLLEFLHTFGPLFNIREVIPTTITFGRLEYALVSKDPDSLLYEVVKFLLQAVFASMEEENESQVNVYVGDSVTEGMETESASREEQAIEGAEALMEEEMGEERKSLDVRVETVRASASQYAKWPFLTQRSVLSELILDSFTCSEILRLHLLASGGYTDGTERKLFRVHRRGNYTDADDPAIALRLRRPNLLEALAQSCIYDLPPVDKLELLSTLCSQLLTYSVSREHMEEAAHRAKKARKAIREILRSEDRREKEEARLKKTKQKVNTSVTTDPPTEGRPVEGSVQGGEPKAITVQGSRSSPTDSAGKSAETGSLETAEDEEQRKLWIAEELKQLNEELVEASAVVNLRPIGTDRYHRKYWHFLSLPGLYVEDSGHFPSPPSSQQCPSGGGPQPSLQCPHPPDVISLTGSPCKSLPPPLIHESQTEPSPETESSQPPPSQLNWSCYCSPDVIDTLLASLNPRGLREVELRKILEKTKSSILRLVKKCPFAPECQRSPTPPPKHSSAEQFLELYLREQILDMEEKIYLGTLGALKGVEDRLQWRESIESSGAAAQLADDEGNSCEVDGSVQPVAAVNPSVRELSQALLQVQAGIEAKFLMPPLGMAVDEKGQKQRKKNGVVKESDLCLEQWRASLAKATSFSQIYLHLSTLERAVMWSKSLMNVRCRICRRKTGDEFLLLCDGCDHGYHTYCLRPPLGTIPEGDWFCYNCIPVTPVKPKRQARKLVMVEEESSEEEEEEEGETEDEDESEMEEEEEVTVIRRSLRPRNRENQRPSGRRTRLQASKEVKTRGKYRQNLKRKVGKRKESKSPDSTQSGEQSQAKRKLKLDHFQSRTQSALASVIELKYLRHGRQPSSGGRREERGLEMQVCEALWEEVSRHKDSVYFATPIKKKEFPDYHEVVAEPMDLRTVRSKIKWNKYNSVDEFLFDMDLIFSNCLSFHKRHSTVGRAGSALQKFFGKRCSDLGIRELLCQPKQD